jgi:ribosome production factor 1
MCAGRFASILICRDIFAILKELGPRFTLKLEAIQKGTFNSQEGEFEWVRKNDTTWNRRKFFL